MPYPFPPNLRQLIDEQLKVGDYQTEDELILAAVKSFAFWQRDDGLATEAAVRDMEQGEKGRPFDEFAQDFRKRNKLDDN